MGYGLLSQDTSRMCNTNPTVMHSTGQKSTPNKEHSVEYRLQDHLSGIRPTEAVLINVFTDRSPQD